MLACKAQPKSGRTQGTAQPTGKRHEIPLTTAGVLAAMALPGWAERPKIGVITTLSGPAGYLGEQIRDGLKLGLARSSAPIPN